MAEVQVHCAHDAMVPIAELKLNPNNRNKHPDEQIERLAKIMKYNGVRRPVIVSKLSGMVTVGHGRIMAMKKLGMTHAPVNFQDYADTDAEYADAVADNAVALWAELDLAGINSDVGDLGPDFDLGMLGIKDFTLDVVEQLEPGCDEDDVPEAGPAYVVRGDVFTLGRHRLMCGDSTMIDDVDKLMAGKNAELCFTSPPYSDQREYGGGLDLSTEHLAKFISTAYGSARYFAVNLGYSRKDGEVNTYWDDYINEARACGLRLLSWNVWDKGECGSIGNQTAMFGISHEWIFVFGPEPKDLNRTIENKNAGYFSDHNSIRQADGTVKKGKNGTVGTHSQLRTIYECSAQKARDDIDHPARFPVEFPEGYIEAMTVTGDVVYEPFCGSGTTMIAAEKTNRTCNGMELDPKYCTVILDRWAKYAGGDPIRESDGKLWSKIKAEAMNGAA